MGHLQVVLRLSLPVSLDSLFCAGGVLFGSVYARGFVFLAFQFRDMPRVLIASSTNACLRYEHHCQLAQKYLWLGIDQTG